MHHRLPLNRVKHSLYQSLSLLCRPEALGIAPAAVFLVCLIICLVGFATSHPSKVSINYYYNLLYHEPMLTCEHPSLFSCTAIGSQLCAAIDMFYALPGIHRRCLGLAVEI